MNNSLTKSTDENKVIDAGEETGVKVKDLEIGALVKIAGRVYRVIADGIKGKQLWFVKEGSSQ